MGNSGSGKTVLSEKILKKIKLRYVNGDIIRENHDDWDFSIEGRNRQAKRMGILLDGCDGIADFICPPKDTRKIFRPDFIIWMDTIDSGKFEDTNRIFEEPYGVDLKITDWDYDLDSICKSITDFINTQKRNSDG